MFKNVMKSAPMAQLKDGNAIKKQGSGVSKKKKPAKGFPEKEVVLSDEDDCGDTDENIIHAAASFNPSGMMSASDSGATSS